MMVSPTYGELIEFLNDAENEEDTSRGVAEILTENFSAKYPHISISRPCRFLDTVKRIAAPTRSSCLGKPKLVGSPLHSYLSRNWSPRIRNSPGSQTAFSAEMIQFGLSENLLQNAFLQCVGNQKGSVLCWKINKGVTVTVGFYRELHIYLQKWPPSSSSTKSTVGRFYLSIDCNFERRVSIRPDNIYSFVHRLAYSTKLSSDPMSYNFDNTIKHLQSVVSSYQVNLEQLSVKLSKQEDDVHDMQTLLETANNEIAVTRHALSDVTNKLQITLKQRDSARKQVNKCHHKIEELTEDFVYYEEEILEENHHLSELVESLNSELITLSSANISDENFQTKDGHVYTQPVRELYYSLLSMQIPPARISSIIKSVLKSFLPSLEIDKLSLPAESCALYMRSQELTTINLAHKAISLIDKAHSGGGLNLNCDGTTLFQKKLQGTAVSGMTLSVNQLPNGSAETMIADISEEFKKLREVAHKLQLPNADKINWTLINSSSSDSASTQKRFNKLVKEKREEDEDTFGPMCEECPDIIELVENFCCMHLGVNLRKAFFDGIKRTCTVSEKNSVCDVLVNEFCKLLGKLGGRNGAPEYAHGAVAFPDYLSIMTSTQQMDTMYYEQCSNIRLERQVGNRYFVSAANAGRILFLRDAAISFLQYIRVQNRNQLEQSVFEKLNDPLVLAELKADAIMFHHVYSNLVMLAKSTHLDKNVLDMNKHYFELQVFLTKIEHSPNLAMDKNLRVFASEERLYGNEKCVNHRLHANYELIEMRVFCEDESDKSLLFPFLSCGSKSMNEKLSSYARAQLPGGKYWEPNQDVETILKSLKPNNDICESILGLNDYLSSALPNIHQPAKSNLIQVKKNKTLEWLSNLPDDQKDSIVDLAQKNRVQVRKDYRETEIEVNKLRQEKMIKEKCRRDILMKKATEEKEQLSKLYLITSPDELTTVITEIEKEKISNTRKRQKQLAKIREQLNIRKKVLGQKINIPFTTNGKQRAIVDIVQDFLTHLETEKNITHSPESLVGVKVFHKFETELGEKWFSGFVITYNAQTKEHEIVYDGEEDHCYFNLFEDIAQGDLIVMSS
jgi:hypothetical protein